MGTSEDCRVTVDLSTEESATAIHLVAVHTRQLAEASQVALNEPDETTPAPGRGTLLELRRDLQTQRRILDEAA